jgi:hypothetical protein
MNGEERDPRIQTFRWAKVNGRKKIHLWLGKGTACGLALGDDFKSATIAYPDPSCRVCLAYAQGWLDRHDHGSAPPLHVSPIGCDTRLAVAS